MESEKKLHKEKYIRTAPAHIPQMADLSLKLKQLLSTYNSISDMEKRTVLAEVGAWISSKPHGVRNGTSKDKEAIRTVSTIYGDERKIFRT